MSRLVIEVSNIKRRGPAFVYPGRLVSDENGAQRVEVSQTGVLVMDPSEHQDTSLKLTSAQFNAHSYELEGKSEGKYGCDRELKLHAVNLDSGERHPLTFAQAAEIVAENLNDDAAAEADQAKQAAEFAAADKDEDDADEDDGEQV